MEDILFENYGSGTGVRMEFCYPIPNDSTIKCDDCKNRYDATEFETCPFCVLLGESKQRKESDLNEL